MGEFLGHKFWREEQAKDGRRVPQKSSENTKLNAIDATNDHIPVAGGIPEREFLRDDEFESGPKSDLSLLMEAQDGYAYSSRWILCPIRFDGESSTDATLSRVENTLPRQREVHRSYLWNRERTYEVFEDIFESSPSSPKSEALRLLVQALVNPPAGCRLDARAWRRVAAAAWASLMRSRNDGEMPGSSYLVGSESVKWRG